MRLEKKYIFIIFYVILGIFLFRNLLFDEGIWNYGDAYFPYSQTAINNLSNQAFSTWYDREFLGSTNISYLGPIKIFYISLQQTLFLLFKNPSTVQFFWYILIFLISCISMFVLCREIINDVNAAFLASLFYALNPWMVNRLASHLILYQAAAFVPLLFYFYLKFSQKGDLKYAFFFSFITLFILPSQHISFISAFLIFSYFIYTLFFIKIQGKLKIDYIFSNFKLGLITILLNSFFLLPFLVEGTLREKMALSKLASGIYYYGQNQSVYNSLRFMGFHDAFYSFSNPLWICAGLFLILLYTISLFKKTDKDIKKYYFWIILLFFVFTSSFIKFVPKNIIQFLQNIPVIKIFFSWPDPNYSVFGIVFTACIILSFPFSYFLNKFRASFLKNNIFYAGLATIIFINALPFFLQTDERYRQIKYPYDYDRLNKFLDSQLQNVRILILPADNSIKHTWAPYLTLASLDLLSQRHSLVGVKTEEATPPNSSRFMKLIEDNLEQNNKVSKILSVAGIRYILLYTDLESYPPIINFNATKISHYKQYILSRLSIVENKSFKKYFQLFEIVDAQSLPHIYPAVGPTIVDGNIEALVPMTETKYLDKKPVLIFTKQDKDRLDWFDWFDWLDWLDRGNNFVFKDLGWRDLAIELASAKKWEIEKGNWEVKETEEGKKYFEWEKKFRVEKPAWYEVYVDTETSTNYKSITNGQIKVDGEEFAHSSLLLAHGKDKEYIKVGEVELGKGKHQIKWEMEIEELGMGRQKIKLVLVNKGEREKAEKLIQKKIDNPEAEVCYIFTKEKEEFYIQ